MSHSWQKYSKDNLCAPNLIHFNNAGAALMPKQVVGAVTDYLNLEAKIGGYEAMEYAAPKIEGIYRDLAQLIGAHADEIALFENATRAWQVVFYGMEFKQGDTILTTSAEYGSNLLGILHLKKIKGVNVELIPEEETGETSVSALEKMIKAKKPKLLAITHVPSQGGLVNPVENIGALARKYDIFYLLDATQSIGQMRVDVSKIKCDALCATGRKFLRGPRGTGFAYIKRERLNYLLPPVVDMMTADWQDGENFKLRDKAQRLETWESSFAGKLGLAEAVKYALGIGMDKIEKRVIHLANLLREKLGEIEDIALHDQGKIKSGIVTFKIKNIDSKDVWSQLFKKNINVTYIPKERFPLDFNLRGLTDLVRASVHYYNTEEEIDRFSREINQVILQSPGLN
ncbi:MAG: aminotransferase class V-fold PLP-dependent enzyme [Deltaproteobacteria bacterium]|nr:MAG: aminotransferase class V-fold PLP-dependent enzyme [Deltaproteobacteria bacterium]